MANQDLLENGQTFADKYRILDLLGVGGGGAVYRALQENMEREVALKVLSTQLAEHPEMVERFRREAKHVSQLRHPNTITVFDFGYHEGLYYIVMELLEGRTLGRTIKQDGPMELERALHVLEQILRSLAEAHERGIVHRDLKPDNIFLMELYGEQDFVKVLDFGIAKALETPEKEQLTAHGSVFGTPSYMSPEQARGHAVTAATDVYAVGLILHEMLTGRVAFTGTTLFAILEMQVNSPLPPLPVTLASSPVSGLLEQACAKEVRTRFPDATEFLSALRASYQVSGGFPALDRPVLSAAPDSPEAPQQTVSPLADTGPVGPVETVHASPPTRMTHKPVEPVPRHLGVDDGAATTTRPPITLNIVPPVQPPPPPSMPSPPPLVGREGALAQLSEMLTEVLDGHTSRLVLLHGPRGVGKTRLMEALYDSLARDAGVVLVRGRQSLDAPPLSGLRGLLLDLMSEAQDPSGALSSAAAQVMQQGGGPEVLGFLTAFVDPHQEPPDATSLSQTAVEMVFARLLQILIAAGQRRSLLMWLDDFQEADELSVYFLQYMLGNAGLEQSALGVIVSARSGLVDGHPELIDAILRMGWGLGGRFAQLALTPLEGADRRALHQIAGPLDPATGWRLSEVGQGNPEVTVSVLEHGITSGWLSWGGAQWRAEGSVRVPESQLDYLGRKVGALMPPERETAELFSVVLQWVAMLGPAPADLVRQGVRRDSRATVGRGVDEVLDHLVNVELLQRERSDEGEECLSIHWPGASEVLIGEVEALGDPSIPAAAGRMLAQSGDPEDPGVHRRAARLLAMGGEVEEAIEALLYAGREELTAGAWARARGDAQRARGLQDEEGWLEARERFELVAIGANASLELGELGEAAELVALVEGVDLDDIPPHLHGDLLRAFGLLAARKGRWVKALADLRRAADWYADFGEDRFCAMTLSVLGRVAVLLGEGVEAERVRQHLDQLAEEEPEVAGYAQLGLGQMSLAEGSPRAREELNDAHQSFDLCGEPSGAARAGLALGQMSLAEGDVRQARDVLERAVDAARGQGLLPELALSLAALAQVTARRGRAEEAMALVGQAWGAGGSLHAPEVTLGVLRAAYEVKGMAGQVQEALGALYDAVRLNKGLHIPAQRLELLVASAVGHIATLRFREARTDLRALRHEMQSGEVSSALEQDVRVLQNLMAEVDRGQPDLSRLQEAVRRLPLPPTGPLFLLGRFVEASAEA